MATTIQRLSALFNAHNGLLAVAGDALRDTNMQDAVVVLFPPEDGQGVMGVNIADALPDDLAHHFTNAYMFPSLPAEIVWGGPNGDAGILGSNSFAAHIALMPPHATAPDDLLMNINPSCDALSHPDSWKQLSGWRQRYMVDRGVLALGYSARILFTMPLPTMWLGRQPNGWAQTMLP